MGRYRKFDVGLWDDAALQYLPRPPANPRTLLHYLVTGPQTTQIPGLFVCGRAALAESLGWEVEDFTRCFRDLSDCGLVAADWQARTVWVPRAWTDECAPHNPIVVSGWAATWRTIPFSLVKIHAWEFLRASLLRLGRKYVEAFDLACQRPSERPARPPGGGHDVAHDLADLELHDGGHDGAHDGGHDGAHDGGHDGAHDRARHDGHDGHVREKREGEVRNTHIAGARARDAGPAPAAPGVCVDSPSAQLELEAPRSTPPPAAPLAPQPVVSRGPATGPAAAPALGLELRGNRSRFRSALRGEGAALEPPLDVAAVWSVAAEVLGTARGHRLVCTEARLEALRAALLHSSADELGQAIVGLAGCAYWRDKPLSLERCIRDRQAVEEGLSRRGEKGWRDPRPRPKPSPGPARAREPQRSPEKLREVIDKLPWSRKSRKGPTPEA